MKLSAYILSLFLLLSACRPSGSSDIQRSDNQKIKKDTVDIQEPIPGNSVIFGSVYAVFSSSQRKSPNREKARVEPLKDARVQLYRDEELLKEILSDSNGYFVFEEIEPGAYVVEVLKNNYKTVSIGPFSVMENDSIDLKTIELYSTKKGSEMTTRKPIIYLYPDTLMDISVSLDYQGELVHTYPSAPDGKWSVHAEPDGTLTDENGKEYYALYWEGIPDEKFEIREGFVVPGNETAEFLEESLASLGLSRREANEFIIYWLPELEKNPWNLIHFSTDQYEKMAPLKISPKPETLIRVMMVFSPLEHPLLVPAQELSKLKKERKGFTVVEWGGHEVEVNELNHPL